MPNPIQAAADTGAQIAALLQEQIAADCCAAPDRHPQAADSRSFLKRGSQSDEVAILQSLLGKNGFAVDIDHDFGKATEQAVRDFQRSHGLLVDGKVGTATWTALYNPNSTGKFLTEHDLQTAAEFLEVEVAAIKAVAEVESAGSGFLTDGRIKILFERHKFYQYYAAILGLVSITLRIAILRILRRNRLRRGKWRR